MKSLFNNVVKHLPEKPIKRENLFALGYVESYDVWLAIEDWEFRIYNYEWWSYDSIVGWEHEDEDWWCDCCQYFLDTCDCMDKSTCEYSVAEFTNRCPEDMAQELLNICIDQLEDVGIHMEDDGWVPSKALIDFIRDWMKKVEKYKDSFVFYYYK